MKKFLSAPPSGKIPVPLKVIYFRSVGRLDIDPT
jgi:hypothetical protein